MKASIVPSFIFLAIPALACFLIAGCVTTETFGSDGKRTSRTSSPSPETWSAISGAVTTFGVQAVTSWTQQIAQQQQWERGGK